jgi:drug/metabolite transporter (DMT)-like permease
MKAHQIFADNPTTVFAGMNFGVILLGTAVGYFFFKERLTKQNLIGLAMAVIAVSLIVYTQL